ncbi:hypothetical protein NA57DRAFT_61051 [Rhizodiscina lignyota]|uniref:Uncharacterized protein n=1 Tax=Rhizodiscina lignyota TaxID=1504668 RepID=A0A9P4I2L0_9PEZI|nr:hypothetical protein NA57DRAFT_61051 [Rhizodiscina lignyota]
MKATTFSALGLLPMTLASVVPREANPQILGPDGSRQIIGAINAVTSAAQSLDMTVQGINSPDLTQLLALNSGSTQIVQTIQNETSAVQSAPDINLLSALSVQLAATQLIGTLKTTLSDLVSKKPYIDQAGVSSLVVASLQQQKSAGDVFSSALTSKVPQLVSILANIDGGIIDQLFSMAIAAFSQAPTASAVSAMPRGTP